MQPIGQLDQKHPDVIGHGQDHLAQGFGLAVGAGALAQKSYLGDPVHQGGHLAAQDFLDVLQGGLGVLHRVVQKTGADAGHVQMHLGQQGGHGQGVAEIGFARKPHLAGMHLC